MYREQHAHCMPLAVFILPLHGQFGHAKLVFALHQFAGVEAVG